MKKIDFGIFVLLALFVSSYYADAEKPVKNESGPPIIIIYETDEKKLMPRGWSGNHQNFLFAPAEKKEYFKKEREGNIVSYKKDKKELSIQFKNKEQAEKFKVTDDISDKFKMGDTVIVKPSDKKGEYELKEKLK